MFLLVDNYDSFTWNLVQAFATLGREAVVKKNDDPAILDLARDPSLTMVCLSPGPGRPENAGLCLEFLRRLDPRVPVLGVCLGHQILGCLAGAPVEVAPVIMHGKQSDIDHDGAGLFRGILNPMKVGRYHSLVVRADGNPNLVVTARAEGGEVMAMRWKGRPWAGVQFHPESVLTPEGARLLGNFCEAVRRTEGLRAQNATLGEEEAALAFAELMDGNMACCGAAEDAADAAPTMKSVLVRLAQHEDLNEAEAALAFDELMDGKLTTAQAGALLMGLRMKGESALELSAAVRASLARAVTVEGLPQPCIDVVGTGGDGRNSFNCSTLSALILAGMGYKVAKHGNRAASSCCGAADALEALGVPLESEPAAVLRAVNERSFAFLFAPHFHPAFKHVAPLRRELGIRTLFNILGPMINPSRNSHLLMGVARNELVDLVAETLTHSPNLRRVAVVCGAGGYDEVTPIGPARAALVDNGRVSPLVIDPAEFGIAPCTPEDLAVHSRDEAVEVLRRLLAGEGPRPMLDMTTLNVGASLFLLEEKWSMAECMARAREAVMAGVGRKVLHAA